MPFNELSANTSAEPSNRIRRRVEAGRAVQAARFHAMPDVYNNSQMPPELVKRFCRLDEAGNRLVQTAIERLGLSARAYNRILKVARSIADLAGSGRIQSSHVAEAIQYRTLDHARWASET